MLQIVNSHLAVLKISPTPHTLPPAGHIAYPFSGRNSGERKSDMALIIMMMLMMMMMMMMMMDTFQLYRYLKSYNGRFVFSMPKACKFTFPTPKKVYTVM